MNAQNPILTAEKFWFAKSVPCLLKLLVVKVKTIKCYCKSTRNLGIVIPRRRRNLPVLWRDARKFWHSQTPALARVAGFKFASSTGFLLITPANGILHYPSCQLITSFWLLWLLGVGMIVGIKAAHQLHAPPPFLLKLVDCFRKIAIHLSIVICNYYHHLSAH